MDRRDLEPGHRLHPGLSRLRPLLRAHLRRALPRRAGPSLRARLRPAALARAPGAALALEEAAADLRQLDVRPVPCGRARRLHPPRLRDDGPGGPAHLSRSSPSARSGSPGSDNPLPWPPHIWAGVSVESNAYAWRANYLRRVPAAVRFISAEPLLGPVDELNLEGTALGHHRRGERRSASPVRPRVGARRSRPLRCGRRRLLPQAVGRSHAEGRRPDPDGRTWDELPAQSKPQAQALSLW